MADVVGRDPELEAGDAFVERPGRGAAMPSLELRHRQGRIALAVLVAASTYGCDSGATTAPRITPGTAADPREVILVARDYVFTPAVVDLVPGETVVIQLLDGGLITHEAVFGPRAVQDAWETAEAPLSSAPPGASPQVSIAPELGGLRIVVASGERKDVTWTVPEDAAGDAGGWFVGCHIPGHWAEGMVVPVRFLGPDGLPLPTLGAGSGDTLRTLAQAGGSAASR